MATAVAARTTATGQGAIQPSSPFSLLLRRSRFSSYDPAVKQTYFSPAAHAHRGDWGLKRPIAVKRKKAHITLESYEHHAQFVQWNPADNQVRLVKRVEELNPKVKNNPRTPWYKGLGTAQKEWLVDSEYAPGEGAGFGFDVSVPPTGQVSQAQNPEMIKIDSLGKKGHGAYGAYRPLGPPAVYASQTNVQVIPNIHAMSPQEFKRYLEHIRTLRPEFKKFLATHSTPVDANNASSAPAEPSLDRSLFEISQNTDPAHHIHFLRHHASQLSKDHSSLKFQPQPHPSGGLQYSHPTPLTVDHQEQFFSLPHRGMILHPWEDDSRAGEATSDKGFAASFGGIIGQLKVKGGKSPFLFNVNEDGFNTNQDPDWYESAMPHMKIVNTTPTLDSKLRDNAVSNEEGFILQKPPVVVGRRAQSDVYGVDIHVDLRVIQQITGMEAFAQDNPWPPGTFEYVMEEPRASRANRDAARSNAQTLSGYNAGGMTGLDVKKKRRAPGQGTRVNDSVKRSKGPKNNFSGTLEDMIGLKPMHSKKDT